MKIEIWCVIMVTIMGIVCAEYPRYKYRGQQPHPKPPPIPQYIKKWQQFPHHQRGPPIRSRPIPIHMPSHHHHHQQQQQQQQQQQVVYKIPNLAAQQSINRPAITLPNRNYWNNKQQLQQQLVATATPPYLPTKKVFLSSPPIPNPPIINNEFQIHNTNNIPPLPIKTIKQIGEKGPIHTIPAPNLSLADKPRIIETVTTTTYKPQSQSVSHMQLKQKTHQYQVTEIPEPTIYKNQYNFDLIQSSNDKLINPNEFYQLINAYPQHETFNLPIISNYNTLNLQTNEQRASDKISNEQTEFHYEEPIKQVKKKQLSSLVTGGYNLEANNETPETVLSILSRTTPNDVQTQSEYVQNYYNNDPSINYVEPDAKPSQENAPATDNETAPGFYVSLPNKEAAEALASLQAAGKINNNLMQMTQNQNVDKLSIYVPDNNNNNNKEFDHGDGVVEEDNNEPNYEDYSQEEMISGENDDTFGHKMQQTAQKNV